MNCTVNGAWPEVGLALKLAVGGGGWSLSVIVTVALLAARRRSGDAEAKRVGSLGLAQDRQGENIKKSG